MNPISPLIHRRAWQLVLLLAVVNFAVAYTDIYIYPQTEHFPPILVAEHLASLGHDPTDDCQSPEP